MNILVLCDAGEVRSVAMAKVLRERGHFAVAGSYDNYKATALTILGNEKKEIHDCFDRIIFMQEGGYHFIGRDDWGECNHPELRKRCIELVNTLNLTQEEQT